jgi:hypothetical protein
MKVHHTNTSKTLANPFLTINKTEFGLFFSFLCLLSFDSFFSGNILVLGYLYNFGDAAENVEIDFANETIKKEYLLNVLDNNECFSFFFIFPMYVFLPQLG